MADITIPPAALEAGARAIAEKNFFGSDLMSPRLQEHHQALARAACLAMLQAWPGWDAMPFGDGVTRLRLPLPPQENSDE